MGGGFVVAWVSIAIIHSAVAAFLFIAVVNSVRACIPSFVVAFTSAPASINSMTVFNNPLLAAKMRAV